MDCDAFPNIDLSVLTDRQREVVEMRYEHRLTFGQIALFLRICKGTVQVHHERALAKLLDAMTEE